jgi:hypothetical protein
MKTPSSDEEGLVDCSAAPWPPHILSSSWFPLEELDTSPSHLNLAYMTKISEAHQKASDNARAWCLFPEND